MKQPSCQRLWQVEAAHDQRLSNADLRAFELHAGQCRTCARERRRLDGIAHRLRASGSPADEIALRRGRERLLEDVHRGHRGSPRNSGRIAITAAVAISGLIGAVALLRLPRHAANQLMDVSSAPGAQWSRRTSDRVEEVRLSDGVLALAIHRKPDDPRVVVVVPDGTIDDLGTEFQVTVNDGHTREVAVRAGAVVLKLDGREPLLLRAPSSWTPPPAPVPVASATSSSEPAGPAPRADIASATPAPIRRTPARHAVSTTQATALASEDLAYLRIIALRREGRSEEARVAAAEYLQSFPDGFRRSEVVAFLHAQP